MNLDLVSYLRKKNPVMALVGATNQSEKFGNIILRDMRAKGYTVVPINPRATTVEGLKAWPDLTSAVREHLIGLVVYVIPPRLTLESLAEANELGLKQVWVQPGAGDNAVRTYLDEHGFDYLMDACVMVEARSA
jgi:uncharacterized protein